MEINPFTKYGESGIALIGKLCTLNDYQQLRNYYNNMTITGNYLIVNIHRLTFSSSHGLGELMAIANMLAKKKKKLILLHPRNEILSIIGLAGIDQVITVLRSEEELQNELHAV